MFCSNCGKKLTAIGNVCSNCGAVNAPLKSFKLFDKSPADVAVMPAQEKEFRPEYMIKEGNKCTINAWMCIAIIALLLLCLVVWSSFSIIKELQSNTIPISTEPYSVQGNIIVSRNNQYILSLNEPIEIVIGNETYTAEMLYISPATDMSLSQLPKDENNNTELNGKIFKLGSGHFMIVPE